MASIMKRTGDDGAISWRAFVRIKGHPAETKTFKRKADAQDWAAATETAIHEGRHFPAREGRKHTMAAAIERYRREILPRKPRTAPFQERQLDWWGKQIGAYLLANVNAPLIVEQRAVLMQEKSATAATANRYMAVLSHLFSVAVKEWGWLNDTPFRKIGRLTEAADRVRFLDDDERKKLLEACRESENPNLYDVVVLALSTGCRKGEILGLRWRDVDLQQGQLTLLDTKNKTPRAVPLTGHALDCMKRRAKIRRLDTDCCFPYATLAKPADVDRDFAVARDKAGIKNFRFHDLRHSAASYLAMNGATLAEIAAVLGHKTLAMVQRYAHIGKAHTSGVVARMNAKLFANVEGEQEGAAE